MSDSAIIHQHTTEGGDYDLATITLTWAQLLALRELVNALEVQATSDQGSVELTAEASYPTDYQPVSVWCCVPGVLPFTVMIDEKGENQ